MFLYIIIIITITKLIIVIIAHFMSSFSFEIIFRLFKSVAMNTQMCHKRYNFVRITHCMYIMHRLLYNI